MRVSAVLVALLGAATVGLTSVQASPGFVPYVHPHTDKIARKLTQGFHHDIDETTISAGHQHTCAIGASAQSGEDGQASFGGPITCWGLNTLRQAAPPPGTFIQVSCGQFHTCAIRDDETMHVSGGRPVSFSSPRLVSFVALACLRRLGTCKCNLSFFLSFFLPFFLSFFLPSSLPFFLPPFLPPFLPSFLSFFLSFFLLSFFLSLTLSLSLSLSLFPSLAHHPPNPTQCWGMKGIARDVAGSFMQVSCGSFHSCALRTDGTIHCWGKNNVGQIDAPEGSGFVQVSCGREHSCALKEDGNAVCWGGKVWGETSVPKGHQFLQISSGAWHSTCAVDLDGKTRCWGANGYGQASMGALRLVCEVL